MTRGAVRREATLSANGMATRGLGPGGDRRWIHGDACGVALSGADFCFCLQILSQVCNRISNGMYGMLVYLSSFKEPQKVQKIFKDTTLVDDLLKRKGEHLTRYAFFHGALPSRWRKNPNNFLFIWRHSHHSWLMDATQFFASDLSQVWKIFQVLKIGSNLECIICPLLLLCFLWLWWLPSSSSSLLPSSLSLSLS